MYTHYYFDKTEFETKVGKLPLAKDIVEVEVELVPGGQVEEQHAERPQPLGTQAASSP
jgi:hypothetical protein